MAPKPTCSAYKCRFHLGIGLGVCAGRWALVQRTVTYRRWRLPQASRPVSSGSSQEPGLRRLRLPFTGTSVQILLLRHRTRHTYPRRAGTRTPTPPRLALLSRDGNRLQGYIHWICAESVQALSPRPANIHVHTYCLEHVSNIALPAPFSRIITLYMSPHLRQPRYQVLLRPVSLERVTGPA